MVGISSVTLLHNYMSKSGDGLKSVSSPPEPDGDLPGTGSLARSLVVGVFPFVLSLGDGSSIAPSLIMDKASLLQLFSEAILRGVRPQASLPFMSYPRSRNFLKASVSLEQANV